MNINGLLDCFGSSSCVITQSASAVVIAMILFLVASGLSLIFGVLGISNFAHGSFYMLGAYITYTVMTRLGGHYWLALILAPLGVGFLGLVVERFLIRRIYASPHIYQFLLTFGLLLVLDDGTRFIWGFDYKSVQMAKIFQRPPLFFLGSAIPAYYGFIIAMGVFVFLLLWFVLSKTKFGKLVSASASDSNMVECLGIDVRSVYTLVFALGGVLAGLGGLLAGPMRSATPGMGFSIIIESFIVMVIGGVGSIGGVLTAAFMVGVMRSFGILGFPDFELFFIFFLVIVVLIIRPWGLFGQPLE
jgi:branched-chain amino acid transport system permease protein